jgi:SAM-dependent methyltransferase
MVAEREGLSLRLELGVMDDLSRFSDASFDLIFHPVSNVFTPAVRPVWREAYRVLRPGGALLAGFANPWFYLLDLAKYERGELEIRHSLPYSDVDSLTPEELAAHVASGEPLAYSHTLEDQVGGQVEAGFAITGFYEDGHPEELASRYAPTYIATRATKPV